MCELKYHPLEFEAYDFWRSELPMLEKGQPAHPCAYALGTRQLKAPCWWQVRAVGCSVAKGSGSFVPHRRWRRYQSRTAVPKETPSGRCSTVSGLQMANARGQTDSQLDGCRTRRPKISKNIMRRVKTIWKIEKKELLLVQITANTTGMKSLRPYVLI